MLTPNILTNQEVDNTNSEQESERLPNKTYKLDFETGEIIATFVDYEESIKQAIVKAIKTTRDQYLVYSSEYGCEIQYLLGESYSEEYLKIEVPRLVDEALMPDERIESTENYVINKVGDALYVKFEAITDSGETLAVEVDL